MNQFPGNFYNGAQCLFKQRQQDGQSLCEAGLLNKFFKCDNAKLGTDEETIREYIKWREKDDHGLNQQCVFEEPLLGGA